MSDDAPTKSFAETYSRGRFHTLLGEAGKLLADAYTQADLENQYQIRDMAFEAMVHSLIEHHGYVREDILPQAIDYFGSGMAARVGM